MKRSHHKNAIILRRAIFLLLNCWFGGQSLLWSQESVEDWQKKAVTEYPQIAVKGSDLNLIYIRRVQSLRIATPSFFNDPRWPYTVAEQIAKGSIIPGMENVVIPSNREPSTSTLSSTLKTATLTGGARVEIVAATNVATKGVVGQMICAQGIVAKSLLPGLSAQDRFYVQLQPDLLCEFMVAPFFTRSGASLGRLGYLLPSSQPKLKFQDGAIFVYTARSTRYEDRNSTVKRGEIVKPGEVVTIYGRLEGNGSIGLIKGLLLRDCSLVSPN